MTNAELMRHLVSRIPPPDEPDVAYGAALDSRYGPSIALPEDYRLFLDVYGPGWFTEDGHPALWILDLVSHGAPDPMKNPVEMLLTSAEEDHAAYPNLFPPAHPVTPGLLPWGDFDQGYTFYWWTDGSPNSWRVMVNAQSEMFQYDFSMLEFLVVNITSMPGEKFFDDGEDRFSGLCRCRNGVCEFTLAATQFTFG